MKRMPRNVPSRYKFEWVEEKKEYRCKKRFRYTDVNGKKHDTDTKWHWTIEECEREADKIINNASFENYTDLRKKKVSDVMDLYVSKLSAKAKREARVKISGDINTFNNASGLRLYLSPEMAQKHINELHDKDWGKWMKWINSDIEHKSLAGATVKKYQNAMLKFNRWLNDEGYISNDEWNDNDVTIRRAVIKKKSFGKRNDRNYPEFDDIRAIMKYYKGENGEKIGEFENFYWYTLFTVLYFTGMRVGELVALQWKNIDFDAGEYGTGIIYIVNSINHKESRENVMARIKARNLELKNRNSEREISMWAYYRGILLDYKKSYRYYFRTTYKRMEDMFVFPNITSRDIHERTGYQRHNNILKELNRTTEKLGINKLDSQMFRHGCAHYLCDVRLISVSEAHYYFGHRDSEMINEVYAKADARQRRHRVDAALKDLITEKPTKDMSEMIIDISDSPAQRERQKEAVYERELAQIKACIRKHQFYYHYDKDTEGTIEQILEDYPELKEQIGFIMDKE